MQTLPLVANKALHKGADWSMQGLTAYSHRDSTRIFEHDGFLYLSNGYQPGGVLIRDLWKSRDAIEWFLVNQNTPYLGWCPVVSFGGAIVALGNTIMRSTDGGLNFTTVLADPPFSMPTNTRGTWWAVVRGDALILIGRDKTWWSTDLVHWSSRTMPFYRENFAIWDFNGSIYVAAGSNASPAAPPETSYPDVTSFNDVWRVEDPIAGTWARILQTAPWARRMWPAFAIHGDEMIVTGGYDNVTGTTNFNDTWASRDGTNWREITGLKYTPRHYSQLVSRNGRLILNNGNRNPNTSPGTINDAWELS